MLGAQVLVDLLLQFAIRMNFVRHGNWLDEGSDQKGFVVTVQNIVRCRPAAMARARDF
jgi:hypothetical protein